MDSEQGLMRLNGQNIREQDVRADNTRNIYWLTAEGELIALPQMTDTHLRNTALLLIGMGYQSFSAPDSVRVLWLRALHCEWVRRKAAKH
jgi:hypothetical protein